MSNGGDNRQRPGPGGWAPSSAPASQGHAPGQPTQQGAPWSAAPGAVQHRPGSAVPAHPGQSGPANYPMSANPMPTSAPTQYGQRPFSAPAGPSQGPYPPVRQGAPGSAPPGYPPPASGQAGFSGYGAPQIPGAPGVFMPQHQRYPEPPEPPPGSDKQRGKKKRSLWDAFMGDLGKNKRSGGDEPPGSDKQRRSGKGRRSGKDGGNGPLAAYGTLDHRLDMSAGVQALPLPGFRVEDGVVVPDDARLRKARRRGPGMGGGRWQRFAFLTAMLLAMTLLMVLGVSRLLGGGLGNDQKLPAGLSFPREAAAGYVERLSKAFFTWDADNPQQRQQVLDTYYPFSSDGQYGWNSKGKQEVRDMPVTLRMDVDSDERATVTVGMSVVMERGGAGERTSFLCATTSVVAKSADALAVDSYPALVACPTPADVGVSDEQPESDNQNSQDIKAQVDRFFQAYADSDVGALRNITTGDKVTDGLGGGRVFDKEEGVEITVYAPKDDAVTDVREARVAVKWLQPENVGGSTKSEYLVTVRKVDGDWKVSKLRPALPSAELQPELDAENRDDQRESSTPSTGANNDRSQNTDAQQGESPASPAGGGS